MPQYTTYSFLDSVFAITSPVAGAYTLTGQGIGQATVSYTTERTAHDVAADGSIMISKIGGNNGQISISIQQTSDAQKWLLMAFNLHWAADANYWAGLSIFLRNTTDGTSHMATGVSFPKIADKPYEAQGQKITWPMMCADIQSLTT